MSPFLACRTASPIASRIERAPAIGTFAPAFASAASIFGVALPSKRTRCRTAAGTFAAQASNVKSLSAPPAMRMMRFLRLPSVSRAATDASGAVAVVSLTNLMPRHVRTSSRRPGTDAVSAMPCRIASSGMPMAYAAATAASTFARLWTPWSLMAETGITTVFVPASRSRTSRPSTKQPSRPGRFLSENHRRRPPCVEPRTADSRRPMAAVRSLSAFTTATSPSFWNARTSSFARA